MSDPRQAKAVARYSMLARTRAVDAATAAGRGKAELGKASWIWADVVRKLHPARGERVLDIGCGFGEVTDHCLAFAKARGVDLLLLDIAPVIRRLRARHGSASIRTCTGVFPDRLPASFAREAPFDCILAYSVLHYTDKPAAFIEAAVRLLAPGGRLLIGDLPNVHRKGRFLSSEYGTRFEARYRGVRPSELPVYRDAQDFARRTTQNRRISDRLVVDAIRRYRSRGYDVWIVPQPARLPYSQTREDLLIAKR